MQIMIEQGVRATKEDVRSLQNKLFNNDVLRTSLPKLLGPLAARYSNLPKETYVRIVSAGLRSKDWLPRGRGFPKGVKTYSDRAQMAIIELVGNKKDIFNHLAKKGLPTIEAQLADVRERLYNVEKVPVQHPVTKESLEVHLFNNRDDRGDRRKRILDRRERLITHHRRDLETSLFLHQRARLIEEKYVQAGGEEFSGAIERAEEWVMDQLERPDVKRIATEAEEEVEEQKKEGGALSKLFGKLRL
ncbi:hypothetical protein HK097_006662 [Rhizophlyctis rosea]|uniref:Uncharacterized protein n=1 Tax=Rhizophlyctis rosea TaxID=64517 RepID=A0AAD5SD33_9FUNG|nr:hypothetical protein HK097_006662 [Rhizophlyctis rosea]